MGRHSSQDSRGEGGGRGRTRSWRARRGLCPRRRWRSRARCPRRPRRGSRRSRGRRAEGKDGRVSVTPGICICTHFEGRGAAHWGEGHHYEERDGDRPPSWRAGQTKKKHSKRHGAWLVRILFPLEGGAGAAGPQGYSLVHPVRERPHLVHEFLLERDEEDQNEHERHRHRDRPCNP